MEVEKGEEEKLQRAPQPHSDFVIRGINPDSGSFPGTIFFEFASAYVNSGERGKLTALATPPARSLTLTGTVSEEGDAGFNTALMNSRIGNVSEWLKIKGHKGPRIPNPQPGLTSGNKDYRKQRAVDIIETPGVEPPGGVKPAHVPDCDAGFVEPCPVMILPYGLSLWWLTAALNQMSLATPAIRAQVGTLFPGVPFATVEDNLKKLKTQMGILPSVIECHNDCDGSCDRGAKNNGTGATSKMTICSSFHDDSTSEQAETFLHESLHATPSVATVDTAYSTTRLIETLTGAQALQNTDSYVLLILRLAGVAPMPSDPPPVDNFIGLTGPEEAIAKPAIALLEQWLLSSESDSSFVYEGINKNIGNLIGGVAQWNADQEWQAGLMHLISPHFGLTDPGDTSPFRVTPVETDKWIMAGVYDRYEKMMRAVYQTPIDIKKFPVGLGRWAPGMGPSVEIGNPFFDPGLTLFDRVKYLLTLLIKSAPGTIPSSRVNAYIESADVFRKGRSVGP
jgi:hypothetical protein